MQQPKWDIYEAVILLDGYLETMDKRIPKLRIVKRISADLRKMAANRGLTVNDIFRNENGISFQMQSMDSAYLGRTANKAATQLFTEVVALYNTDRNEYENLLKEARAMINEKENYKEVFSSWLSETVPAPSLSKIFASYEKIEQFCVNLKVIKAPLFETMDVDIMKAVQKTVSRNKIFRILNTKQLKEIDAAMLYLSRFISEGNFETAAIKSTSIEESSVVTTESQPTHKVETDLCIRTEEDKRLFSKYPLIYKRIFYVLHQMFENKQDGLTIAELYENTNHIARCAWIEDILDNVSWVKCDNRYYSFSEEIIKHDDFINSKDSVVKDKHTNDEPKKNVVDFNSLDDYSYTKPMTLSYFGKTITGFSSWTGLYVALFSSLYPDYSHLFDVNMSFTRSGGGRIELCNEELHSKMVAPKPIPGTSLYLETNISAKDIVGKIRFLLNLCNVDYNNVVIEYQGKSDSTTADQSNIVQQNTPDSWSEFDSKEFASFLCEHEGMAENTCKSYTSAINFAERFAKEHNLEHQRLFTHDWHEAKATVDTLFCDPEFIKYNDQQHNRFRAAMRKLLLFLRSDITAVINVDPITAARPAVQPIVDELYQNTLVENFHKGFRLGSPIELRKFRRYYELMNSNPLDEDDAVVEQKIASCGIVFEDKVFTPQTMLSDELRDRLCDYIKECFAKGKTALYYQAIFNEFSEEFLDYYIYNADMLKSYLSFLLQDDYFFGRSYLSKDATFTANPVDEIRTCLKEYSAPMKYEVMFEDLSHIPQQKIKQTLATNSEFISNGRGEYFHVSAVHFSDEEMDDIAEIIADSIAEKEFLSGNELIAAISSKYPYTCERNSAFSVVGLRDAIKYHLCSKFSFSGNIISRLGSSLTMSDVFADFCRSRDVFILDELNVLATELGTIIYFDPVYENSLRISKERFMSKKHAHFLVPETDATLDRFCTGDYISIGKIRDFSIFPDAGFPWNVFLLEHYIATYSAKYSLLHIGFNANKCVGAIVKKSSEYANFDDCIVNVLADSSITLKKQSALQYLCDEGYIARRIYTNIEELLIKATAQRNRKEAN